MQSSATTVAAYLKGLPAERRASLEAVRKVIRANLDPDFAEGMQYGMIGYFLPHAVFPDGYHCDPDQPLPFGGLASQKNHMSVYLMGLYETGDGQGLDSPLVQWFRSAWAKTGKKLDMGKCCIRFKHADDLALDVLGEAVRRMPAKVYLENYQAALASNAKAAAARKAARKASKQSAPKGGKKAGKTVASATASKSAKKTKAR